MSRELAIGSGPLPPKRAGWRPRHAVFASVVCALGAACSNNATDQVTMPIDLGMTSQLGTYYSDENLTLYQVETPVQLPVRKPTAAEVQALGPAPKGTPYPAAPFVVADDEDVEVRYTISNLDAQANIVWLLVNPWNEFVRYEPGVQVVSDEETLPNFGYDQPFIVPAKSRLSGTLTADDMHEIAIKLASVMNLLASPQAQPSQTNMNGFDATVIANNIFNPQNRSNSNDPLYTPWIPPVIAGLTGFTLGLRYSGDTAPNMAVEVTVDVHDLKGNHFVDADDVAHQMGEPTTVLSPPAARF